MNDEPRGPWYLLTGLVIGLALGLLYTWLLNPVQYIDTAPDTLRPEFKDQYRSLIAQAYTADADLGRAVARLQLLNDDRPDYELGAQAQRVLAGGGSQQEARALAQLAADYTNRPAALAPTATRDVQPDGETAQPEPGEPTATLNLEDMILTATPQPTVTSTPRATFTPRSQTMLQPELSAPLVLKEQQEVCTPGTVEGLLQVEVYGEDEEPLAGVRIDITWDGGQESFYTGLFPEINLGYADFEMQPGVLYSLRAGDGGEEIRDLTAAECTSEDGAAYLGGVRLVIGY